MIVADTSALISIAAINLLDTFLTEFDIHTTETVIEELEAPQRIRGQPCESSQYCT
jgi:rRNA-processing protein FCF1